MIAGATALCGMSAPTTAAASQPAPVPFVAPQPIREIVDQQLGARYAASDKEAVARCVTAALAQGAILYGVNGYAGTEGYAGYAAPIVRARRACPAFPELPRR